MNGSELTEEQLNYICRWCLEPIMREARLANMKANDPFVELANKRIEKIEQIFRTVGYWK